MALAGWHGGTVGNTAILSVICYYLCGVIEKDIEKNNNRKFI